MTRNPSATRKAVAWFFAATATLICGATSFGGRAQAALVTATITGTVQSIGNYGSAGSGGLGVFNQSASSLLNTPATLVFTFDDTLGTQSPPLSSGGVPYYSSISGSGGSSPGTAVLTIGGVSVSYPGTGPAVAQVGNSSNASRNIGNQMVNFQVVGSIGQDSVTASLSPDSGKSFTTNYSWEASFNYTYSNSNINEVTFNYARFSQDNTSYVASQGSLTVKSIKVVGTSSSSQPLPHIIFNGVDVTANPSQAVAVVGQQINLSVAPHAQPASWSVVPGNTLVGDYTAKDASSYQTGATLPQIGMTIPPNLGPNISTTFYWYSPGTYQVTYSYLQNDGTSGTTVPVSFAVSPAPTPVINEAYGKLNPDWIFSPAPGELSMGFGNPISHPLGVTFSTPTDPGGGTFEWIQLVQRDVVLYYTGNTIASTCTSTSGLDAVNPAQGTQRYPAYIGDNASDSPNMGLFSQYTKAFRSFTAQMYLMWQLNKPNSIPVPLGFTTWGFAESSQKDVSAPLGWSMPLVKVDPLTFFRGTQYPTWSSLSETTCN